MNANDLKNEIQCLVDEIANDEEIREDLNAELLENVETYDLQDMGYLTNDSGFVLKNADGQSFIITVTKQ